MSMFKIKEGFQNKVAINSTHGKHRTGGNSYATGGESLAGRLYRDVADVTVDAARELHIDKKLSDAEKAKEKKMIKDHKQAVKTIGSVKLK